MSNKARFNKKYGFAKNKSHSLNDISKISGIKKSILQEVDEDHVTETERKYIDMYDCVNKLKPGNTVKESKKIWIKNNPDYYKEYQKKNHSQTNGKKYYCECCKKEMLNTTKYRHFKTKKHLENLKN